MAASRAIRTARSILRRLWEWIPDLRVKPFFAEGSTISIREFVVGALHKEMGLEASTDPDLLTASAGGRVVTPSGMVLDGSKDKISPPPAPDAQNGNEIDPGAGRSS